MLSIFGIKDKKEKSADVCEPFMQAYLSCVESKTRGLSEGDECMIEASAYKKCRIEHKGNKAKPKSSK